MFYRTSLAAPNTTDADLAEEDLTDADMVEARLLAAMAHLRNKEIDRGISLVGPHRDELELFIDDLPAKGYASHGESWSLALGLRLASYELLRADDEWHDSAEPVLILDDVFAELDLRRRDRLAQLIAPAEQVLITAAVAEDVAEALDGARVDGLGSEARRVRWGVPEQPAGRTRARRPARRSAAGRGVLTPGDRGGPRPRRPYRTGPGPGSSPRQWRAHLQT